MCDIADLNVSPTLDKSPSVTSDISPLICSCCSITSQPSGATLTIRRANDDDAHPLERKSANVYGVT